MSSPRPPEKAKPPPSRLAAKVLLLLLPVPVKVPVAPVPRKLRFSSPAESTYDVLVTTVSLPEESTMRSLELST